jgi:hypothetical protein
MNDFGSSNAGKARPRGEGSERMRNEWFRDAPRRVSIDGWWSCRGVQKVGPVQCGLGVDCPALYYSGDCECGEKAQGNNSATKLIRHLQQCPKPVAKVCRVIESSTLQMTSSRADPSHELWQVRSTRTRCGQHVQRSIARVIQGEGSSVEVASPTEGQ